MVKRVEYAAVRPGVVGWMETLLLRRVGVYFANEGKGAVEMGVPGYRADGSKGRGVEGRAGVDEALQSGSEQVTPGK